MSARFDPKANINDLPSGLIKCLSEALGTEAADLFLASLPLSIRPTATADSLLKVDYERLLVKCGNLGFSAIDLLNLLHQARLERPQLILHRRFAWSVFFDPVRITQQPSPSRLNVAPGQTFSLTCKATGFPYPQFQWLKDDLPVLGAVKSELQTHISATSYACFSCLVFNEIKEEDDSVMFYRRSGKQFSSECLSSTVMVTAIDGLEGLSIDHACSVEKYSAHKCFDLEICQLSLVSDGPLCCCGREKMEPVRRPGKTQLDYKATDKVALIISNSAYENLPPLVTPVCDAECLAEGLLKEGFKTVTLGDLNLKEMRAAISEYCQLLGLGVYALFYFVGHGIEARGQCYLLPVDAPQSQYNCADCLCAEEVLGLMQESNPALNVILLDMCRRYPPQDIDQFAIGGVQFKPRVNRNTVFGYATSFGEGAYEVLGQDNGIFMKYLKKYLHVRLPITEVLSLVMEDLEKDEKAGQIQFPELKTNLSRPRTLCDDLVFSGHTKTFDVRTVRWQQLHEIPNPSTLLFAEKSVRVTVWFDFCGHFTNLLYSHYSIAADVDTEDNAKSTSDYTVDLEFDQVVEATAQPGSMPKFLLKHLQRLNGPLQGRVTLRDSSGQTISMDVQFGCLAISSFGIK